MFNEICKEAFKVLKDCDNKGVERPWREKKLKNEYLAFAYDVINPDKAARLRACGSYLAMREYADGTKKLDSLTSCRVRLCPMCSWRRSLRTYANVRQICSLLLTRDQQRFAFLTLTIKNCLPEELDKTIDFLFESFNRFAQLKEFKVAFNGWYRSLEITHNLADDTFHPHIHLLLSCNKSYFTSRNYLSHDRLTEMWRRSCRLSYVPMVDIRKVRVYTEEDGTETVDLAGACAEIAKYTVKDSDYILADDWDLTFETVELLDLCLNKRRLIGYSGNMRAAHKLLHLPDEEQGDLIHIDQEDEHLNDDNFKLVVYRWHSGYSQYFAAE